MKIYRIAAVSLLCLLLHAPAQAQSPVWKVTKGKNHLFIGGTIHVLATADYPLPESFDTAYGDSAILVLEADIRTIETPEIKQILLDKGLYKGEDNLTRHVKPGTAQALEAYAAGRGIPFEQIIRFKPWLLSVTLLGVELQRLGQGGTGVDEFYCLKALNEQRPVRYLETITEQLEFLSQMGAGIENEFMQYTLADLNDLPGTLQAIKQAWKNGDNERLATLTIDPLKKKFPKLYATLVTDRNSSWVPHLEKMLTTKEVEFVLIGSLHLVGKDGVVLQLKKLGYSVDNI